jgi:hypothetical protein
MPCSHRRCCRNHVPAVTIDRQCGSSQQAIQFAAQAVMSRHAGRGDRRRRRKHDPRADGLHRDVPHEGRPGQLQVAGILKKNIPGVMWSQFMGAEMIVKKHGFTKDQIDAFALQQPSEGKAATEAALFKRMKSCRSRSKRRKALAAHRGRRHPLRRHARRHRRGQAAERRRHADRGHLQPDLRRRVAALVVSEAGAQAIIT